MGAHLPSFVNTGATLLAAVSVNDFHAQVTSSAVVEDPATGWSSTSVCGLFLFLRGGRAFLGLSWGPWFSGRMLSTSVADAWSGTAGTATGIEAGGGRDVVSKKLQAPVYTV